MRKEYFDDLSSVLGDSWLTVATVCFTVPWWWLKQTDEVLVHDRVCTPQ